MKGMKRNGALGWSSCVAIMVKVSFILIMIRNLKEVRELAVVKNVFPGFE